MSVTAKEKEFLIFELMEKSPNWTPEQIMDMYRDILIIREDLSDL